MKKKTLSNKEKRHLNDDISPFGFSFDKKDVVEKLEDEKYCVIEQDGEAVFFYLEDRVSPSLRLLLKEKATLKAITVDMGAVKFVVNGADIMRPGIVAIDSGIAQDEFVVIVDAVNKKPLAVGVALFSSEEIESQSSGKVVRNIHFVGDEIWNLARDL